MNKALIIGFLFLFTVSQAQYVHDPVIIRQDSTWYLFCRGNGITVYRSAELNNWQLQPPVFDSVPGWTVAAIPSFKGHLWAPDISYYKGWYYLYYAVSTFGKNRSAIGVAVNKTLNRASPDYKWIDKGMVVQSVPGRDAWNAIDPDFILDGAGVPWLSLGSFWGG
ncbi:glycosyl hydrolase family 43 [Chitinophaga polysaccharea]|uniref:Glycosyl hydrolase family 43 n=1 Tax=Chitinophaga polysaccharea TaxID=1293035 RepID=A0A561PTL2_9BACT|nr:family 43 glycosylhydrolase [Chitinophaga polysaccharea]TWF41426.1 glycosyl hydrolase family 43 [Chitinophaga polysaccharea]